MDDLYTAIAVCIDAEESSSDEELKKVSDFYKRRTTEVTYETLIPRHLGTNEDKFKDNFRLTPALFAHVLYFIETDLEAKPFIRNKSNMSAEQKLCVFLRFLATGESLRSIGLQYKVSHKGISKIINQVADSLVDCMIEEAIPSPTEEQLKKNIIEFQSKFSFPNCVGAIDGRHIRIKTPGMIGCKSIVMISIVDANYKFIAVDVGDYGKEEDANIYLKSKIGLKIHNMEFKIPRPKALPGARLLLPNVFVGSEAFGLYTNLLRPYNKKQSETDAAKAVYNNRLSQAGKASENVLGILCGYFPVFFQPFSTSLETTDKLTVSACILHNLLRDAKILAPGQSNLDDPLPLPRRNLFPLKATNVRPADVNARIRELFKDYFKVVGAVTSQ